MVLPLTFYGTPVLREKGATVESGTPEREEFIENMFETTFKNSQKLKR